MRLYLVRHGQSQGNINFVPGALRPKTDPLTELGREQADHAARYLNSQKLKPTLIISSPYTRTLDTAKTIEAALKVPLIEADGLREYDPGDWNTVPWDEYWKLFNGVPVKERYTFRPPKGESWLDAARRFEAVIEQVADDGHTSAVMVSHLDPIQAVVNLLTAQPSVAWGEPADYPPGSVTLLSKTGSDWELLSTHAA
jgi:broad specificity phosphatase PhoE